MSPPAPTSPAPPPDGRAALAAGAERVRDLLVPGRPLVLPNAWDVASARRVVAAGFPVVATSSAAVAEAHGHADGDVMPPDVAFGAVAEIRRAVDVPVTADIEAGYRLPPDELVDRLAAAGAVGCNLEDTDRHGPSAGSALVPAEDQASRLAAVRAAADDAGTALVVNARVDVWARPGSRGGRDGDVALDDDEARLAETVRRARLYLDAGADSVYPIGLSDEALITRLVETIEAPVNVWWRPAGPTIDRLAAAGAARVSLAAGLFRTAYAAVEAQLAELAPHARPG